RDQIAWLDLCARRRRAPKDARDLQAARVLYDRHADTGELAPDRLFEQPVLVRREIVREPIMESLDHPLERAVLEEVVGHLLGVVVLDDVRGLRMHGGRLLHERVSDRSWQIAGMAAEVEAGRQRGESGGEREWPHEALCKGISRAASPPGAREG